MDDHPVRKDMAYWKAKHNSPARFIGSDWNFDLAEGTRYVRKKEVSR